MTGDCELRTTHLPFSSGDTGLEHNEDNTSYEDANGGTNETLVMVQQVWIRAQSVTDFIYGTSDGCSTQEPRATHKT